MCAVWLIGFSLRVPLWDADAALIARPITMRHVFPGGVSQMINTMILLGIIASAYLLCLWAVRGGFPRSFPVVIGASSLAVLVLLPMRPLTSPDVTHLAADVRTFWLHGAFPAVSANAPSHIDDPIAQQVAVYSSGPSGYGPVAYAIGGIPLPFVGDGLAANVAGQKFVGGAFLVLTAFLAGMVARRLGQDPALAAAFIGLNPLMLWEFAGDGHDDTIMAAFGVAALLFVLQAPWRARGIGAVLALASVLSKFSLVLASPVVVASWFPRWRKHIAAGLVLLGGMVIVVLALRVGPQIGTIGPASALSLTTPQTVVGHWVDGGRNYRNWVVLLSYAAFILIAAAVVLRHRLDDLQDQVAAIALLLWLFVFACSPGMLPWYQIWYLPFVALSRRRWMIVASLVFSIGGFLPILSLNWQNDLVLQLGMDEPVDVAVILLWGATAAAALVLWRSDSRSIRLTGAPASRQATRALQRRRARGRA
jgi:hypothetical protein